MDIIENSPRPKIDAKTSGTPVPHPPVPDWRTSETVPSWPGRLSDLLEGDAFESSLRKEEARANRTGSPLSLVVFAKSDAAPAHRELIRALADRVRATDSAGFMQDGRAAVILPDANAAGAWTFADAILGRLADENVRLRCTLYCHPFDGGGEGGNGRPREAAVPKDESREVLAAQWPPGDPALPRDFSDLALLTCHPLPRWRRGLDVVVSSSCLLILAPVLLLTAIAIKATSPGPVLFTQPRAGRGGRPFAFHKFRSMYVDADERKEELRDRNEVSGPVFKIPADPRITPVGRFLRRSSIDELPQLWNILKGDMTLIGPRPPTFDEVPSYEPWQRRRLSATVGLICIREVSGRSEVGFQDWVRMDLRYIDRRSPWLDFTLLFRAVGAVLSRRGAF